MVLAWHRQPRNSSTAPVKIVMVDFVISYNFIYSNIRASRLGRNICFWQINLGRILVFHTPDLLPPAILWTLDSTGVRLQFIRAGVQLFRLRPGVIINGNDEKYEKRKAISSECGLRPIIGDESRQISQPEPAKVKVGEQRAKGFEIGGKKHCQRDENAQQPQLNIGFQVAVVRLVEHKGKLLGNQCRTVPQPKTFKAGPKNRVDVKIQKNPPDYGPVCEGRIAAQRGNHIIVNAKK